MGVFDFLFGSGQGGGTKPPLTPTTPSGEGGSLMDILSTKPAVTTPIKPTVQIAPTPVPPILSLMGKPQPVNPLIKNIIPSAADDYNKHAELKASTDFAKNNGLKTLSGKPVKEAEKPEGVVSKLIGKTEKGLGEAAGGVLNFGKSLLSPVVQTTGAATLKMFQGADWLAAKASGTKPTKLTPQQQQAVDTMTAQGIDSLPATILTLGTFGGAGAFAKLALPTAMMKGAISEMQGKGLKTSSEEAVKMYIFSKLLSLPLGKTAMAGLGGGMQVANEAMNGQNILSPESLGETAAATGLGFLGGRAREMGHPLGETPPLHETAIGGGELPAGLPKTPITEGPLAAIEAAKADQALPPANLPPEPSVAGLTPKLPERGFLQTVQKGAETTAPLKKAVADVKPQTYEPVTNAEALKSADDLVRSSPETAREYLSDDAPASAEKGAVAIRLAKHYEEQAQAAGVQKNDVEMNKNYDRAVEVIETYDRQLRESGRFVQAASLWSHVTPEGMLRKATREIEKANSEKGLLKKFFKKDDLELTPEDKRAILQEMGEAQKLPEGSPEKDAAVLGVLQRIANKIPISKSEMFDAYRYQNMLSGPQTQLRNIYSNLLQTYVSRPSNLAIGSGVDWIQSTLTGRPREIYAKDVPTYYKGVMNSQMDALHAAAEAFAGKSAPSGKLESTGDVSSTIQQLRQKNVPSYLTTTTRMLEATDKYFSTLIASGEKARLQGRGMSKMEIDSKASKLAEETLFRGKLEHDPDAPLLSQALSSLGQILISSRKLPVVGKPLSWFVPFVTTPIRVAKYAVESSPAGFIGGKYSHEQIAKATVGSLITAGGAWLAMNNKTTWDAPTDKDAKESFYASGRKPYSVLIGNKWVPMWYFGPYAFSLAIPAAIRHHEEDSKTKLTDSQLKKMGSITGDLAQFLGSQSPLQGMTGFFRMIQGDTDYSTANNLGFTAGQVIPLQGLIRYVNKIIDPVYRKSSTFAGAIESGLPGLSKKLPAYTNSKTGEPEKRDSTNLLLPYDLGRKSDVFEKAYQDLIKKSQTNAVKNKTSTIRKDKTLTTKQKNAKVKKLKAGGGVFDGVPILDSLFDREGDSSDSQLPAFNPP